MKTSVVRFISITLALSLVGQQPLAEIAFASYAPQLPVVAVMPFEIQGLSEEESGLLRTEFLKSLKSTDLFAVMSDDTMWSILTEAKMTDLKECTYSHCIAEVGKVLGVDRVFHVSLARKGKLYTVRVRVVGSSNSDILLDKRREHSGEFEPLVSTVIPEMAREMQEAKPASLQRYKWYFVAGAVVLLGTAIYFISRSVFRSSSDDTPGQPDPGPAN